MAFNSKIEWTEHTANLWHGCSKVHAGCDNCYAETLSKRWGRNIWGNDAPRMEIKSVWNDFKKMQKNAQAAGRVDRVFVGSMMDIFEKPMLLIDNKGEDVTDGIHVYPTFTDALRDQFFEDVVPKSPNLLFLLLTKRPSNINKMIPREWLTDPPDNVMFGTSPCNQDTADMLLPQLWQVNGLRFLSVEPMLGPVSFQRWSEKVSAFRPERLVRQLDWVICGGESGPGARPLDAQWCLNLLQQCEASGVPFFMKQGSQNNWPDFKNINAFPEVLRVRQLPEIYKLKNANTPLL